MAMKKKRLFLAAALVLAALLVGCTSKGLSTASAQDDAAAAREDTQPVLQDAGEIIPLDCDPLTGEKLAEDAMQGQRPVAVMLDNSTAALPQTGISAASVVYEMVTEGGIPRLMAVYRNMQELRTVGPVRSTRDQFVQLAVPENMLLLHIGSSIYATNMLQQLQYPTVDGIELGTVTYVLDTARAASGCGNEHCWYVGNDGAQAGAAQKGISATGTVTPIFHFVSYEKTARLPKEGTAGRIEFSFSQYVPVAFDYSAETMRYAKSEYGQPQTDRAGDVPVSYTNLILLGCNVTLKSDGLCTDFDFSSGEGWYFYGGGWQKILWEKGEADQPLQLMDTQGDTLQVNVGTSYVAFVENRALQRSLLLDGVSPFAEQAPEAAG